MKYCTLNHLPSAITIFTDSEQHGVHDSDNVLHDDIHLSLKVSNEALNIRLSADESPIQFIRICWRAEIPEGAMFLGDAWERTYGDMQWRHMDPGRFMPWYFLMSHENITTCFGVKVRTGALACWQVEPSLATLWLDVRCGGSGVCLNGRELDVATVISSSYENISQFNAAQAFCRKMSKRPLLPTEPIYGTNNWYYAYGESSSEAILEDSRYLAGLTEGLSPRPFMVIDAGWQREYGGGYNGGPWTAGNKLFPDMRGLADGMRKIGVRPGIWFRPLLNRDSAISESMRLNRNQEYLDPSITDVLDLIHEDITRICSWGFELLKHDFTTFDIFGRWGFEMNPFPACGRWTFHDRSKTSAEIISELYRTIYESAGTSLILGCNTIGHLGAGLMHIARTGDDTSGKNWERTRKMGINTLAFRLPQHNTFFAVDADCVGITEHIPWELNRQWAELLACSGTTFFASVQPGHLKPDEFKTLKHLFQVASQRNSSAEPLDWMTNTVPDHWLLNGDNKRFNWIENDGATPEFISERM